MKIRRLMMVGAVMIAMLAIVAAPAGAEPTEAPGAFCQSIDNTFPADPNRPFPFELPSTGACASSVAQGFNGTGPLTTAAFAGQCKFLESMGVVDYPYAFYGNADYLAKNRADCMTFLRGFHEGTLIPGPGV